MPLSAAWTWGRATPANAEAAAKRPIGKKTGFKAQDVDDFIDYICSVAERRIVHFLWRPLLSDPKDDMILELAVAANCDRIVSYHKGDFHGVDQLGIRVVTAREFLHEIGELP